MRESHRHIALRVGQRLKELRGAETQADYAARLGLSQAQYNRYETGTRLMPDRLLELAAGLAGLDPEQMVFGPPPPPPDPPGGLALGLEGLGRELAALVALLPAQDREDLYYFLRAKTEALAQRQQEKNELARQALENIKKLAV
ncbi:MAG: helix-turn-helix domain-containing protein [Deltaproteobacteria bacterium]|nr:helix-turn-helix domain-containing protein [Deltaproteobacteria bacterium]